MKDEANTQEENAMVCPTDPAEKDQCDSCQ